MLSKKIIDTDAFMDMPLSTQALYMHLVLNADDDGFVGSPKKVMRSIGCMADDIRILEGKRFILSFESGVIVIKHWAIHNLIRSDRYTMTTYTKEKSMLSQNSNKSYTLTKGLIENVIPSDNQMDTQVSIGKVSLVKVKKDIVDETPTINYKEIIDYLNKKLGTKYKSSSAKNQSLIKARINEGYDINDFKTVIDKKYNEWNKTDMATYLRPETLFSNKFEGYLNQVDTKQTHTSFNVEESLFGGTQYE
jgi:uncharacterized phage protein (TIGR02220 family)